MPRTLLTGIATLALAMTYCFIVFARKQSDEAISWEGGKKIRHSERSEESHRRTDGYIFLALVVGYFACAQYDVKKDISLALNMT